MDRRGFLKRALGAGAAAAAKSVLPAGSDLVRLECKGCRGVLKAVGDFFECESCGARYALGGVVMQEEEEEEPQRVMEDLHLMGETVGCYEWFAMTTTSEPEVFEYVSRGCRLYGFRDQE
jgi:hypothetical protein